MSKQIRKCLECGKEFPFYNSPSTIIRGGRGKFCSRECCIKGKKYCRGAENNKWKGGISINELGYILVKSPDHPNKDKHGYFRKHRLVMEEHLGRYLLKTEEVHHINGDKTDNRIENLQLISSRSEHLRLEHKLGTYINHLNKLNGTCTQK
jgi:hypothetical protein